MTTVLRLLPPSALSRRRFLGAGLSLTAGLLLPGRSAWSDAFAGTPSLLRSLPIMGTAVECQAFHEAPAQARRAVDAAFAAVRQVDRDMSVYSPDSDIGRLNRAPGRDVAIGRHTAAVLRASLETGRASGGALDVTITPLLNQWGFYGARKEAPGSRQLDAALALVDYRRVHVDGANGTARLGRHGMQLDLGGIAKGFAVDQAVAALRAQGVRSGMVNAGGDLGLMGRHPDGDPWVVGVQHPLSPARLFMALSVDRGAVATSGNYLRYRVYNGRRYGHLLHPRHGYPADTALSMTVVATTAMRADALATAAMVMGRDGLAWIGSQPGVEAVMVSRAPSRPDRLLVHASRGLRDRITLLDDTAIVEGDS